MDRIRTMLGKLLHDEIFKDEDISPDDEKSTINITEPKNERKAGKLKKLTVIDAPMDVAVFSLDHENLEKDGKLWKKFGGDGFDYFSWLIDDESNKAGKRCDIVIVAKCEDLIHVIIVEVKSFQLDEEKIYYQLMNSYLVLKYLFDMLDEYHLENIINQKKIKLNFYNVVFTTNDKNFDDKLTIKQEELLVPNYITKKNYDEVNFDKLISFENIIL